MKDISIDLEHLLPWVPFDMVIENEIREMFASAVFGIDLDLFNNQIDFICVVDFSRDAP